MVDHVKGLFQPGALGTPEAPMTETATMATSALIGSYPLTAAGIDAAVTKKSAGAYALGSRSGDGKTFYVHYVGRSDGDVAGRLKRWVGVSRHPRFKFQYCTSPKDAFETECNIFHDFGETSLDNKVHCGFRGKPSRRSDLMAPTILI